MLADKRRERDTLLRRVMAPYPMRINRNRLDTLYSLTRPDTTAELTYFFHPDHLGSASWITDLSGQPVQHLQYKPFGGDYIDQQDPNTEYSERFRFTGKERDAETGYDYFGARYYSSSLGIWLSVDPMSDKYPSLSPYVYCADNPVNVIDPFGMDTAFMDPIARKDFLSAMNTVNSNVNDYTEELSRLKPESRKYNRKQKQIEKWMKLKADFDYICSPDSPMNTYTSNPANLGENADIAAKDNGFTVTNYNKETNEILSNLIYVKSGRESSYVHENRHSRQSPTMSTYEREVEAFQFQQIYNSRDVQELIDNARRNQYPDDRLAPPISTYGIEEMVKYRYGK